MEIDKYQQIYFYQFHEDLAMQWVTICGIWQYFKLQNCDLLFGLGLYRDFSRNNVINKQNIEQIKENDVIESIVRHLVS